MLLKRAAALQEEVARLTRSGGPDPEAFRKDLHAAADPGSALPGCADPGSDIPGRGTPGSAVPGGDAPGRDTPDSAVPGGDMSGRDTPASAVPGDDASAESFGTALRISQMQMEMKMRRFLAQRTKLLSCIEEISGLEKDLTDPAEETVRTTLAVSRQSLLQLLAHVESEIHLYQTLQDQLQTGTMAADMLRTAGRNEQLAEFRKRLKEEADRG